MFKLNRIARNKTEVTFTRNGKPVHVFFSYDQPVAALADGVFYRTEKTWSKTTSKHITQWLDGVKHERKPQSFFDNLIQPLRDEIGASLIIS